MTTGPLGTFYVASLTVRFNIVEKDTIGLSIVCYRFVHSLHICYAEKCEVPVVFASQITLLEAIS